PWRKVVAAPIRSKSVKVRFGHALENMHPHPSPLWLRRRAHSPTSQYALNRLIRLDRHSGIHTRESRAGPHGGSLELPIERPTLLRFDFTRRPGWLTGL